MSAPMADPTTPLRPAAGRVLGRALWTESNSEYPLTAALSAEEQSILDRIGEEVVIPAGATLFRQGAPATEVHVIRRGAVAAHREGADGERSIIGLHLSGDICGLAEDGAHFATAQALCPSRTMRYPVSALAELIVRHPTLDLHLLAKLSHDLRSAQRQIMLLSRHRADDRVAVALGLLLRRGAFFDPRSRTLKLPMSRFELSSFLALTRETLARSFHRLEAAGRLRRLSPSHLVIRDEGYFRQMASML